jgi:cystathionine beta-lyase/cystathionine gamma-synthase
MTTHETPEHSLSYILNHLGESRESYRFATAPPIWQTSNFAMPDVATMRTVVRDELANSFYTRGNNPTVEILRKKLAALECCDDALVFGSGAAAMAIGVLSQVQAGDHIIAVQRPYSWTKTLLSQLLPRYQIQTSFVDGTRVENFQAAIQTNTKLIVLETPNSLTFELQDLQAVAALARQHQITTIVDNSFCSPLYQKPHRLGIDLVMHSGTKYLSGHSDVLAGVLCGSKEMIDAIFRGPYMTFGPLLSPHDAWLMLRGLRTMPIRMEQIHRSTQKVVAFLKTHRAIKKIHYALDPASPQAALAAKQMGAFAGLISIEVDAKNFAQMEAFCDALELFLIAASWGGYESLQMPIVGFMEETNYRPGIGLPFNLVRLSIGLEDPELLIADLAQALGRI